MGVSAGTSGSGRLRSFQLLGQRSLFIVQDNARHRLQQHAIVIGDLFEAPDEDAARLVEHLRFDARGNQTGDLVLQGLAINRNVFVQNDQVDRQSLHAPVGVRLDELPDDLDFRRVADAQQDDRRVARDAVAPKTALAAPVVEQHAGAGTAGGVGINQRARQPGIELGLRLRGVEMAQGDLAVGPGEIEGAVGHARALVFFHERQRGFPAFGHAHDQVNAGGFVGRQGDRAPQRDDGIQHGTDGVGQRRRCSAERLGWPGSGRVR